jgi:hypothetical protein
MVAKSPVDSWIIPLFKAGWWFQPTPLKNDGVNVSSDYDIPNKWKFIKTHVPNHQPDSIYVYGYYQLSYITIDLYYHILP